ncbi:MAG TPA: glucoamylase family protein [Verrucomicrobiae bacterium]|nr:glucoamylase family protein [Verrucomicrobiae bacterium]
MAIFAILASCSARAEEVTFADYNDQGFFNNFSGDSGVFANMDATLTVSFDNRVFHGSNGASLRLDYSVPTGFCGLWNSALGKMSYTNHTLNFTNLYGALLNSSRNPSRVENVHVTNFTFWACGNGDGDFSHEVKVEFKSADGTQLGSQLFSIPNRTNWTRFDFPIDTSSNDWSRVKEIVFVIENWRNDSRKSHFFIDDLAFTTDEPKVDVSKLNDDQMLDLISQRDFFYFLNFTDDLGFALDRSTFSDIVSTGTIGFQLTAYCIGHERGWADKQELENRIVTILRNLNKLPTGPEADISHAGYRGFFYHFLAANAGTRKDPRVELSLYDTALLMYGVLTCQEYFPANKEIQTLSRQLSERVEWDWFVDHKPGPHMNQYFLSWMPGPGKAGTFFNHVDGQTDEALMVDLLALGSPTHPVSFSTYLSRNRLFASYPRQDPQKIMVTWKGSLFNYFFASCWLDFHKRGRDLHPTQPCDLWENDRLAIMANRQFCIDHSTNRVGTISGRYATYGENAWGLTACDNLVAPASHYISEYIAFGALPNEENSRTGTKALQVGTVPVYGAASAINFLPTESIAALRHDFEIPALWSPIFGFGDAFSLDPHYIGTVWDANGNPQVFYADYLNGPWINHTIMGINVGPMLLAIDNYRSGLIWKLMAKNPQLNAGLNKVFGNGSPASVADKSK